MVMNPMTCNDIDEQIELFAIGECDPPTEAAMRRHMAGCARCARAETEARRFLSLVDFRMQETDRLERLLDRIEAEAKPAPATLPMTRAKRTASNKRWFALAASILLPLGIGIWLTPSDETSDKGGSRSDLSVALLPDRARGLEKLAPAPTNDKHVETIVTFAFEPAAASIKAYRSDLQQAAFKGQLPAPPEVNLVLEIHNSTDHPIRLRFDDPNAELRLTLSGNGALRVNGARGADPFAGLSVVRLAAGATFYLPIERLIGGSRQQPVFLYWTAPGQYRLRAVLRIPTESSDGKKLTTISGLAVPIRVR